jgi:hypothetical protein
MTHRLRTTGLEKTRCCYILLFDAEQYFSLWNQFKTEKKLAYRQEIVRKKISSWSCKFSFGKLLEMKNVFYIFLWLNAHKYTASRGDNLVNYKIMTSTSTSQLYDLFYSQETEGSSSPRVFQIRCKRAVLWLYKFPSAQYAAFSTVLIFK